MGELPPFVHRKIAKGKAYYYFAVEGAEGAKCPKLVRLPDMADPTFDMRVAELYGRRPPRRRTATKPDERQIYFIGADSGPIKIGLSRDPDARCREMKVGSPTDYRVLATVIGGYGLERAYHLRFEFARLRGEWFDRRPEIEAEIERLNKTRN